MTKIHKFLAASAVAAAATFMATPANSFWGPFNWFDDGPGWNRYGGPWGGGPWGGYPGYGYRGYPGYGYYPGYSYGGPAYGYGGYPAYGYGGYPAYGYPYAPVVPSVPVPTQ